MEDILLNDVLTLMGRVICGIIITLVIIGFLPFLLLGIIFNPAAPGQDKMEKEFQKDVESFIIVRDYITASEYSHIVIRGVSEPDVMITSIDGRVKIENQEVVEAVRTLDSCGYSYISGGSNFITFLRWNTESASRGIIYMTDGSFPKEAPVTYITKVVPLSKEGWYYYEENYN